jgi:CDP-paratose 2-epimerase
MMKWLITGGYGFVGVNATAQLLADGARVAVLDNLQRPGAEANRTWLSSQRDKGDFFQADIRDAVAVRNVVREVRPDVLLHLAAQVAVTTSVADPRSDFEINALGTLNLLEAVRQDAPETIFLYASTNKVYGGLEHVRIAEDTTHYLAPDYPQGIDESHPLDFHSPYGCSKGVADQYVRDYARVYGLRTVVFRQSCIYGPHQFGVEDQGWVAWMTIAALTGRKITLYGTGKQVRDLLYVDDLVNCYRAAAAHIGQASGQIFNMGGGPANSLSLVEFLKVLEQICGRPIEPAMGPARPGDQPFFVADIQKARRVLGWAPAVSPPVGTEKLVQWVKSAVVAAKSR